MTRDELEKLVAEAASEASAQRLKSHAIPASRLDGYSGIRFVALCFGDRKDNRPAAC